MKKMIQLVFRVTLVFLTILICSGCPNCDDYHREIIVVNKTHKDIAFLYWASDCQWYCSPGTMILDGVKADTLRILESPGRQCGWESSFTYKQVLYFLFTDEETYVQYMKAPCDTIRKYLPVLQCYQLTLEDLQQMNWTVVYPPEE
jgi:hypothetical protein